jgi:PD-(D/E)XK nuclease superfamily
MDTITIRTSERATFKRCPQKWYWSYVEQLKPYNVANALWFGTAVHEALADWYKRGKARGPLPSVTFSKVLDEDRSIPVDDPDDQIVYQDARELGMAMLDNYIEVYKRDPNWAVIATEMTFEVMIKHPAGFMIRYVGTWDGVYKDLTTNEIWLMEHKTASVIDTAHLPLDDQAGSYWAVAEEILRKKGVLRPGQHIAGIMYNFLKKSRKDDRPINAEGFVTNKPLKKHYAAAFEAAGVSASEYSVSKMVIAELQFVADRNGIEVFGDPSKEQPAELLVREAVYRSHAERKTQIERIKAEAIYMHGIRNGDPAYPVYKTVMQWGPVACARCEFFQICQLNEAGDAMEEEMKEALYYKWEPYAAHEIEKKSA